MLDALALIIVVVSGLYLVGLAVLALARPALVSRFLLGFAGSARLHYLELLLRLIVGIAFLRRAPYLQVPEPFLLFGWLLILTTLVMFAVPWRWHHRFTQKAVPRALQHLRLFAIACMLAGLAVLVAVVYPSPGRSGDSSLGSAATRADRACFRCAAKLGYEGLSMRQNALAR